MHCIRTKNGDEVIYFHYVDLGSSDVDKVTVMMWDKKKSKRKKPNTNSIWNNKTYGKFKKNEELRSDFCGSGCAKTNWLKMQFID